MLINNKDLIIGKRDFNYCYIYYKYKDKVCGTIVKVYDKKNSIYAFENNFLVFAEFDSNNLKRIIHVEKDKTKKYIKKEKISFQYSVFKTKEIKKERSKKLSRKKIIFESLEKLNQTFSKKYYIRIINKSSNIVGYISLLDAFFIGTNFNIVIGGRNYKSNYWYIDNKYLLKSLLHNKELYKTLYYTYEMYYLYSYKFFKENSSLYKLLTKIEKYLKKYYKGN